MIYTVVPVGDFSKTSSANLAKRSSPSGATWILTGNDGDPVWLLLFLLLTCGSELIDDWPNLRLLSPPMKEETPPLSEGLPSLA